MSNAARITRTEWTLFFSAAAWTVVGLAGGLGFREITKAAHFDGATQLAVVHTHALTLGTVAMLAVLALNRLLGLGSDTRMPWFIWTWNIGLLITVGMLAVIGTLQISDPRLPDNAALDGVAGMGHILLTAALVLLFLVIGSRLNAAARARRSDAGSVAPTD
jgi:hypothetical protein